MAERSSTPSLPASVATRTPPGPRNAISRLRNADFEWDYKDQPPEFWNQFTHRARTRRAHPRQPAAARLDSEVDIWRYIEREQIPIPQMYFCPSREDGKSYRFRSLGCWPITKPVESKAANISEIISELMVTEDQRTRRPSPGSPRAQCHAKLRAKGFM